MQVHQYFIIVHHFLTHLIHMFSHPITHISSLSHSLGHKDDSLSCLSSSAKAGIQHNKARGEKKGLHSLIKGSVGHRNGHIWVLGNTCRLINSTERFHLEIHKITIIDGAPPRLIPTASQLVWCHPTTQPWATLKSTSTLRL